MGKDARGVGLGGGERGGSVWAVGVWRARRTGGRGHTLEALQLNTF